MPLSQRERLLRVARKEPVDERPFCARIDVWYNYHLHHGSLPNRYRHSGMVEILRDQGAGCQIRHMRVWRVQYEGLEVAVREEPPYRTITWKTPVGAISMKTMHTPEEGPWIAYEVSHPFQSPEDYRTIAYVLSHTRLVADFNEYAEKDAAVGDDGIVVTGMDLYSPMQSVMRYWLGYERFFFELRDHREQVERLYELEKELATEKLRILIDSPVEVPALCANWSDEFHTPVFERYFVPWLREASDRLHAVGKLSQVHADGEMKRLAPLFLATGVDVAEAWSPAPMTRLTTAALKDAWGDDVTIWGGIPSVLFGPQYSDAEFDRYVTALLEEMTPWRGFILGMGDNLPFDGEIDRVGRAARLVRESGRSIDA